ncbi:MAG: HDIG domain-containing protein [Candidatus Hinthialibacter antarcticus]|nr:HDIG domain-containing protein [Candidatus Hinthialibacter antarcticus]
MSATSRGSEKSQKSAKSRPSWMERIQELWASAQPHWPYALTLAVAAVLLHLLIRPPAAEDISRFRLNEPAPRVVSAPFDFDYADSIATEARRRNAEAFVAPVYKIDQQAMSKLTQTFESLAEAARTVERDADANLDEWADQVAKTAGIQLPEAAERPSDGKQAFIVFGASPEFWNASLQSIYKAAGLGIADNIEPIRQLMKNSQAAAAPKVAVGVNIIDSNGGERAVFSLNQIRGEDEFFAQFETEFQKAFSAEANTELAAHLAFELLEYAYSGPNLLYDSIITNERKTIARDKVEPMTASAKKDETLVGKDVIVTAHHLQILRALNEQMRIPPIAEVGYFLLAILFISILLKYLAAYYPGIVWSSQRVGIIFAGVILILGVTRAAEFLSTLDLGRNILSNVAYAIPMGALGVILTILQSARLAAFVCALTSIYVGIILQGGPASPIYNALVCFISGCGAIYTVTRIRQRSDLYRAGGVSILLAAFMILAIDLQQQKSFELFIEQIDLLKFSLMWAVANGILVSVLAIALMPMFEDIYGKTTDMRLLELSQKTELLQKLEQEAPGSYQHSMRVATLAETASQSIGANALLTRVGCYYHDIGKVFNPQYFVENQQSSADKAKHSKITPNMSCLIIRNHVKHGTEMARQNKLPEEIISFIPEHHGTTLMSYFYHQALSEDDGEGKVKEDDYRYPGPKPQSPETAIVMLADALEATSRLLDNPAERDVRQLVRKIINERFMDGQFDECDLTLKDLHTLYHSFSESIMHTLHQRIAYPAPPGKEKIGKEKDAKSEPKSKDKDRPTSNGESAPGAEEKPMIALKEKRPAE